MISLRLPRVIVLNATFNNNISVISWQRLVLVVKKTGVPGENYRMFKKFVS
jgi:hypothetical protein